MQRILRSTVLLGLALTPLPAAGQTAQPPAGPTPDVSSELPLTPEMPVRGLVPGVGPTPGVVIVADSPARKCSQDAAKAADGLMAPQDAIVSCNEAITSPVTPEPEMAGTLVNRGVLLMTMEQPAEAKRDFGRALEISPEHAEALVNNGIILHSEGRLQEALAAFDRGIALGPERPERAYYSRGLVREDLKDIRGAYADYKMAESLRPGWDLVVRELSRFQVRTRAAR